MILIALLRFRRFAHWHRHSPSQPPWGKNVPREETNAALAGLTLARPTGGGDEPAIRTACRWRCAVRALGRCGCARIACSWRRGLSEIALSYRRPPLRLPAQHHAELFFHLYFAMTSLHAVHLLFGILCVVGLLATWRPAGPAKRIRRVHAIGLYLHFVDIVWVFLFPVLYLVDR